jgi:hypothetical protein
MSADRLTRAAFACFLVGLALILFLDVGVGRIVGVPLMFTGIALGVRAIASPEFLEGDLTDRPAGD